MCDLKPCDICGTGLDVEYVDGRLGPLSPAPGSWANMCWDCFKLYGVGLGVGRGQHYRRKAVNDHFTKVAG